ncbi:MAG: hypothetical protein Kow0042_07600 [Calditrichia bacterium]
MIKNHSKFFTLLLFFIFLCINTYSQKAENDSSIFLQQVEDLINQKKFATAHYLLADRLRSEGFKPLYICWMVRNGLQNHYKQEKYEYFYLKDEGNPGAATPPESEKPQIARLKHPLSMLLNITHQYPHYAWCYKLLGDYYNLQLEDLSYSSLVSPDVLGTLKKNIFGYYKAARNRGVKDPIVNRWLGTYFLNINQPDSALKYFQLNVNNQSGDALSFYRLAEINYQKKQFAQAYNYALQALEYVSPADLKLSYDIRRLAARSLLAMGEHQRFVGFIEECIKLLPDEQIAYLDLIGFYESQGYTEEGEQVLQKMLLRNPFDAEGFRKLEEYSVKFKSFFFADSLFNEIQITYENWDEALANVYWSKGNLAYYQGLTSEANKFWDIARNYFRKFLPEDSPLLNKIGKISPKKADK